MKKKLLDDVERIQALNVKDGDIVFLKVNKDISVSNQRMISEVFKGVFRRLGVKAEVVLCFEGVEVGIVNGVKYFDGKDFMAKNKEVEDDSKQS